MWHDRCLHATPSCRCRGAAHHRAWRLGAMKRERNSRSFFLALVSLLGLTSGAEAALVDAGPGSFTPLAPVITFEEVALGTVNPVYNFNVPSLGGPVTITFGGNFVGQAAGGGFPVTL